MTKFKHYHFAVFCFLILFISQQVNAQIEVLDPEKILEINKENDVAPRSIEKNNQKEIITDDLIHFGDLVDVDILGSSEYDWRGTITNEGYLDGIEFTDDEIYALCKTEEQVAKEIAKSYGKFLKNPKIEVSILDRSNRPITTLFGAIKKPQRFKIKRKVFLRELIVLSGGFTEKASGTIQILRQPQASCLTKLKKDQQSADRESLNDREFLKVRQDNGSNFLTIKVSDLLEGKSNANLQILYGDIITVQTVQPIYVIGGVVNPGKLSAREKLTVTRAVAATGGLTKKADAKSVTIFRRVDGKTVVIKIDLPKIAETGENDVELKAYDVIHVAEKGNSERLYPPVINFEDADRDNGNLQLPLTIID